MVSESKTTAIAFPYERQAMNGEEIPDGLGYPEQILYLSLRLLYKSLHEKVVDRETAIREKKKLMDEYRVYKFREEMGEEWVRVIKATDLARAAYQKDRTLENADKLICVLRGEAYG